MRKRFVIRKPHRTALWAVWDKQDSRFVLTACLTRKMALNCAAILEKHGFVMGEKPHA